MNTLPPPHIAPSYRTPAGLRRPLSARFPNLSFYWRMASVIRRGGAKAARGDYGPQDWVESSLGILRAMEYCGGMFEIDGLEHVTGINGPCVFVGNHMSTLETFVLPCMIQPHKDVTFVVKKSLLSYPWFRYVLGSRDPIQVGRADPRADLAAMLEGGAERLARGRSVIVFPQGSRSLVVDPGNFNSIGIKMAERAKAPVIPIALRTEAWGNGKRFKDFGPIRPELGIHFRFGAPMEIGGRAKSAHAEILRFIRSHLEEWGLGQPL